MTHVNNNAFELKLKNRTKPKTHKRVIVGFVNPGLDLHNNQDNICNNYMEVKNPVITNETSTKGLDNPMLNDTNTDIVQKKKIRDFSEMEFKSISMIRAEKKLQLILKQKKMKSQPIINPYEVKRPQKQTKEPKHKENEQIGLINSALDVHFSKPTLKTIDCNFEVLRKPNKTKPNKDVGCFENPALEIGNAAIAVSFTPSIGMRVDFNKLGIINNSENHSNNMACLSDNILIEKPLLLSVNPIKVASENMDIENEIDMYQSELENSINEAKNARKSIGENKLDLSLRKTKNSAIKFPLQRASSKRTLRQKVFKTLFK